MKQIILSLFVILLTTGLLHSQITIQESDWPTIGDTAINLVDTMPLGISIGSPGSNQYWDLSKIQNLRQDTAFIVDPATTGYSADFPAADHAYVTLDSSYLFWLSTPGFNVAHGAVEEIGIGPVAVVLSPVDTQNLYPGSYLNTLQSLSSFDITFKDFSLADSIRAKSILNREDTIDGWGTCETPLGTYDALRVKRVTRTVDSAWVLFFGNWTFGGESRDTSISYEWWAKNLDNRLATVNVDNSNQVTYAEYSHKPPPPLCTISVTVTKGDVSCNGGNDGSAMSNPTSGDAPYTYSWNTGQTTQSISGLTAGTYTVETTDSNGCVSTDTAIISEPFVIMVSASIINTTCNGGNDGSIDISVTGGVPPYSYSWSPGGETTQDISNLAAASYAVVVTDSNSCIQTDTFTVSEPSMVAITLNGTDVTLCTGNTNGAVDMTVTGATPPYTYSWSNGETSEDLANLAAGNYIVTVTDSNGCTATDNIDILEPTPITLSITTTDTECNETNGSATVTASGGSSPYTYLWSNGDTGVMMGSVGVGSYILTVADQNGCEATETVIINNIGGLSIAVDNVSNTSCNGTSDGAISISVTGGATPYTYDWSNGATTEDITNLVAGAYEIVVTDADTCKFILTIDVEEPDLLMLNSSSTLSACGLSTGSATVDVSGGTGPYTYMWSTGGTDSTITGISAASYQINVTDINGCTDSITVAVSDTGAALIAVDSVSIIPCGVPGSILITVSGGVPPYIFNWSNGDMTEDLMNVPGGIYTIQVTDGVGCVSLMTIDMSEIPPAPTDICVITVDSISELNLIVWERAGVVDHFNIYKEGSSANVFQLIGTVPFDSVSEFVDSFSNPRQHTWKYKISAEDSCGNESQLSDEHKTIHLTSNLGIQDDVNLIWNSYRGFSYPSFHIFRRKDNNPWVSVDIVANDSTIQFNSYNDTIPPIGDIDYMISVNHPDGCTSTPSRGADYNSASSNTSSQKVPPVDTTNAIQEIPSIGTTVLFPNPTMGLVNFEVVTNSKTNLEYSIHNILGVQLEYKRPAGYQNRFKGTIDLSAYLKGIYIIKFRSERGVASRKVVVE